jgi:hypothetical protein
VQSDGGVHQATFGNWLVQIFYFLPDLFYQILREGKNLLNMNLDVSPFSPEISRLEGKME